ncbi:flagellar assembly protein A [Sutcliffiella rhizosphaerae]|uniref:RNA-binding protein KhpB N-terminal domain-containing protein n=1 Tax=Sutcliffiella rhizosphaerae TaxID=2880967 RepID=A0ABN8A7V6_9BACI|nr:flagellar assembly protein A [Sutcliffiella rhizosphaerae]CAG9621204.1 hypothetical protein BACCIP111883_01976 [Sutcliffiella rhizosphaerae]
MQRIVSRGRNIQEAIEVGLHILQVTQDEVDIDILQHAEKSFLGIRRNGAVVKLTKLKPMQLDDHLQNLFGIDDVETDNTLSSLEKEEPIKQAQDSTEGKVWVKGEKINSTSSPSYFPTVSINKGLVIYKNQEPLKEKTIVLSTNDVFEIKIQAREQTKKTKWKVFLDERKLRVYAKVEPGYHIIRSIPDIHPARHIEITLQETKEIHNTLSYIDLMNEMEKLRVIHGFNHSAMMNAIETNEAGTFEIATGIEAKQGKDGWVEKVKIFERNETIEVTDSVDYREKQEIATVEKGTIFAIIHPPIPGKIGYTVSNEPIPAKQTFPVLPKLGNGVTLEGNKVVATESGRPHIENRGLAYQFSIMPKYVRDGNVDLETGNIRFKGDVEVTGEVEEQMLIEAGGDITVHKTVYRANLSASGSIITYGSVIDSDIKAGKSNLLVSELGILLRDIYIDMEKISATLKQLIQSPSYQASDFAHKGLQPLVKILLDKKFKKFTSKVKKYVAKINKNKEKNIGEQWINLSTSLANIFLILRNDSLALEDVTETAKEVKRLYVQSMTPLEPNSFITIPNALNSRIYCSGNMLILDQGSINSHLHSGGTLKVNGIVRGGEVYGKHGVAINEAGAESGTSTLISVPSGQTIKIQTVKEGTTIKIGSTKHTFTHSQSNINAHLNKEGKLILSGS